MSEELLAAQDLVWVLQEGAEELELSSAQLDRGRACADPPRAQVKGDASFGDLVALLRRTRVIAKPRADPGHQLLEVKRLTDVIVGTRLQPGDAIRRVVPRREDDHRHLVMRGSHVSK